MTQGEKIRKKKNIEKIIASSNLFIDFPSFPFSFIEFEYRTRESLPL